MTGSPTHTLAIVFAAILATGATAQDGEGAQEAGDGANVIVVAPETVETGADAVEPIVPVLDIRSGSEIVPEDFLWLNRLIVVFANSDRDPNFREQLELLAERPQALAERDIIVITDTDPAEPSAIRTKLRPRGFGFVFIDKDGVVKLRKPSPWQVREIIRSIDKTELRQQEIRDALEADR